VTFDPDFKDPTFFEKEVWYFQPSGYNTSMWRKDRWTDTAW